MNAADNRGFAAVGWSPRANDFEAATVAPWGPWGKKIRSRRSRPRQRFDRSARIVRRTGWRRRSLCGPTRRTSVVRAGAFRHAAKVSNHSIFVGSEVGTRTPRPSRSSIGKIIQRNSRFDSDQDLSDPKAVPKSALRRVEHISSSDTALGMVSGNTHSFDLANGKGHTMRERLTTALSKLSFADAVYFSKREIIHAGRSERHRS